MLLLGEVRTCLLRTSTQLPLGVAEQVLELLPGRRVLTTTRPCAKSVSAPLLTGVDCKLASPPQAARGSRVIGTVSANAVITGGLVLQASARTRVVQAARPNRLPWSHYAALPGVVEAVTPTDAEVVADGFLGNPSPGPTLDLGAVAERLIGTVQRDRRLDHVTALRSRTIRVRWVALPDATARTPRAEVRLVDDVVRSVRLAMPPEQLDLAQSFVEDFALHDWLLTSLDRVIEDAERRRMAGEDPTDLVRAAVERLEHLWMPGARIATELAGLWPALDSNPGYSRQWNSLVGRIHSQIALRTLQALADARRRSAGW
ncbi:SCO2521 family protein [Pseudofrankia sp. DC12]|uniref:SCO2521 family protein n=1 Tax=Pseudofrankia sp. DC12 TaxID=683315 RepID=UPI0005F81D98|nr:SCO2521 family protein [Pseudofrankia sp. DC12]